MRIYKLLASCMLLIGLQANANMISIELDNPSVSVGETVNVSLLASFTDAVDTIDFEFLFDNSLFSFVSGSEASDLPNDGFLNFFSAVPNTVGLGLGFVSFESTVTGSFLFASFQLERTSAGVTEFSLQSNVLSDFLGNDYMLEPVNAMAVSAPSTAGLFALAGLALLGIRRKA
ncbi:cohesin domain-containing protein [Paraglaciecola aquimarina]|uniref:Cohesin domain-containing protein n=1 Tax=Paraglaciecola aquimarina TaxID=1235557 RepID=A0ABU3SU74_9ALTE|nr:cohesin domain-containing protein [Paraglaciecola aquimarina]MDU0353560.1 cohesin domain-containing protein [Paraglaciecola aquimarina]